MPGGNANFTIEPMTPADWPSVCAIYADGIRGGQATFERSTPTWEVWDAGHRPDCRFVARAADGRVLGWIATNRYSSRGVYDGVAEESVYVAEEARGRGVGRALLEHLIEASERAEIWTLQAGVIESNTASLALHEGCGFRRVGVRERIGRDIHDEWTNVVLLERRSSSVGL